MAIITRTLQQLRQSVATKLGDLYAGTADTGSTTSFMKDTMLATFPNDHFNGWNLTALFSGTPESRIVTDFTKSGGSVDFSPAMSGTIGATPYEMTRTFSKAEYDGAINDAIRSISDVALLDKVDNTLAYREDLQSYNIPSGFVSIYDVQYDTESAKTITQHFGSKNVKNDASLGTSSIAHRAQSFTVGSADIFVRAVALLLRIPNSYDTTRTMTVTIETDSTNVPSDTAAGTATTVSSTILDGVWRWVVFSFPQRIRLAKNTRYHICLADDITTADVRVSWGIDSDAGYAGEWASTASASTVWGTVGTQDHPFILYADEPQWASVGPTYWQIVPASTRELYINRTLTDGASLRVLGYQAPSAISAETDNCPVSPEFVEAKAVATLCSSRIERRDNDGMDYALQYKIWYDRAESLRASLRTRLRSNTHVVESQ